MNIIITLAVLSFLGTARAEEVEFKKAQIKLNNKTINIEVAKTLKQQNQGLMFRTSLIKNTGMIFIYKKERPLSFWMKNTFIPLSIAFFNKDRVLINIEKMRASKTVLQKQVDIKKSKKPAMYALEMNQGWFQRNNIKPGHKFEFIHKNKDLSLAKPSLPKRSAGVRSK